jgi:transcriptional regulator with XRE-family HTH domain
VTATEGWTGETACALQAALRLSQEAFAARLGISARTVSAWHQKPDLRPQSEMQQLLDTVLEQSPQEVRERYAELTAGPAEPNEKSADAERRLSADPNIVAALDWLDQEMTWEPGTARREVATRLATIDVHQLQDRAALRTTVDRSRIADALSTYYADRAGHGLYRVQLGSGEELTTSILTRPDWLDLDCPLTAETDRIRLTSMSTDTDMPLDAESAGQAAQRLAETLASGIRVVDMPLYRLTNAEPSHGQLAGSFALTRFTRYAVTMDLLEGELVDQLAADGPLTLPLRDRYLPDVRTVLDLPGRLCAGGTLALLAIARPANPLRGPADYVLLVQERSAQVLNAARRLAVIPKGFHQPMTDHQADAQIGATLRREMEEELFGRDDIDNTLSDRRRADPMHPSQLSEPMTWLLAEPGRLRMECTGFGLNLVSGNYEFPGLIVIEDETFWDRFGGLIEANWEASGLRQYSSLDPDLLAELITDPAWSNEGLFALLQGLRRLAATGDERVNAPSINWETA